MTKPSDLTLAHRRLEIVKRLPDDYAPKDEIVKLWMDEINTLSRNTQCDKLARMKLHDQTL